MMKFILSKTKSKVSIRKAKHFITLKSSRIMCPAHERLLKLFHLTAFKMPALSDETLHSHHIKPHSKKH